MKNIISFLLITIALPKAFSTTLEDNLRQCLETERNRFFPCNVQGFATPIDLNFRDTPTAYAYFWTCSPLSNLAIVYQSPVCLLPKPSLVGPPPLYTNKEAPGANSTKNPWCEKGSIINVSDRTLGEQIDISGLAYKLSYNSQADSKRAINRTVKYRADYPTNVGPLPFKVIRTYINQELYSRVEVGETSLVIADVNVPSNLMISTPFVDKADVNIIVGTRVKIPEMNIDEVLGDVGSFDSYVVNYKPEVWGLGGWTLSIHHYYEPTAQRIFWGYGGTTESSLTLKNIAGIGQVYVGAARDGSEIYLFDSEGRHIETRTSLSGIPIYTFRYNSKNQITEIQDRNGLITKLDRSSGQISIVNPFNVKTDLSLNAGNKLSQVADATGAIHNISYHGGDGLISEIRYPSGMITNFNFTGGGYFSSETKNTGSFQEIVWNIIDGVQKLSLNTSTLANKSQSVATTGGQILNQNTNSQGQSTGSSSFNDYREIVDLGFMSIDTVLEDDPRFGSLVKNPKVQKTSAVGLPYNNILKNETISRNVSYVSGTGPFNLDQMQVQKSFVLQGGGSPTITTNEVYKGSENSLETSTSANNRQKIYFDEKERPIKVTSSGELDTTLSYNSLGQLISVKKGSAESTFSYDSKGHLAQSTNPKGNSVLYERDANGLVTKQTMPNGEYTEFIYTPSKKLKTVKTSSGNVHEFEMSLLEKVISYLPPLLSERNENLYEYDSDGRILRITKPDLGTTVYTYKTGTNFVERISTPSGDYQFNQIDVYGRPSQFISPDGIRTEVTWIGQDIGSFKQYDGSLMIGGMVIYRNNAFGYQNIAIDFFENVEYAYDANMRMTKAGLESYSYTISNEAASANSPETASVNITTTGNTLLRRNISYFQTSNGFVDGLNFSQRTYNSLQHVGSGKVFTLDSIKDANGNIIRSTSQKTGSNATFDYYQYDVNGRLKSTSGRLSSQYDFTANNNISKYTHGDKVTTAVYDAQDRLLFLNGSITRDFQYNKDGTLKKISNCLGEKSFEYDFFGNLKKVTLPNGKIIQYKYDAFNRRVARLENGVVKNYYVWQDGTRLTSVLNPDGTLAVGYAYGIHPIAPIYFTKRHPTQGLQRYTVVANDRGDIRYAIDGNGNIAQEIEYDEYGMILSDSSVTTAGAEPLQPLGFVSGLTDRETGLVRFGARDYDPVVGRWTAKDPVMFDGGDTNLYGYTMSDPVNFIDKNGLWSISINAYSGLGGGITIGQNPNGSYYSSVRAGVGVGGGLSWDPQGKSPDGGTCSGNSIGQFAEGSANFGPLEAIVGTSSGVSPSGGKYYNPFGFSGSATGTLGVGIGVSGGLELTFQK